MAGKVVGQQISSPPTAPLGYPNTTQELPAATLLLEEAQEGGQGEWFEREKGLLPTPSQPTLCPTTTRVERENPDNVTFSAKDVV